MTTALTWTPPPADEDALMAWFAANRARDPVCLGPNDEWHIFGYAEAAKCLTQHTDFANATDDVPDSSALKLFGTGNLSWMDPPRHGQLRSALTGVFSSRHTVELQPMVAALVGAQIERVRGEPSIPFIDGFAAHVTLRSIATIVGLPPSEHKVFARWLTVLLRISASDTENVVGLFGMLTRDMDRVLHELIEERRVRPQDDLVSRLVAPQPEGVVFSDDEVAGVIALLVATGQGGAVQTLANALICLDRFPEATARLRADPSLLPAAIDEVMRYRNQTVRVKRRANRRVRLGDHDIPAGAIVSVWLSAANRDPAMFDDPESFIVDRRPNPHLSFGKGIHYCLGAPLGQLQVQLVLDQFLQQTDGFAIDYANSRLLDPRIICGAREIALTIDWRSPG